MQWEEAVLNWRRVFWSRFASRRHEYAEQRRNQNSERKSSALNLASCWCFNICRKRSFKAVSRALACGTNAA